MSEKNTLDSLYREGHQMPDPDYIKSLMLCMESGIWSPSDKRRESQDLGIHILEGAIVRHPDNFFPPKRLLQNGGASVRMDQILFWRKLADLLLWEAQQKAYSGNKISALNGDSRLGIKEMYTGYAVGNHQQNLYFDVDSSTSASKGMDIAREVERLKKDVKSAIEAALNAVVRDRAIVDSAVNTATVYRSIIINVVFQDIIERIDFIRSRVEDKDDMKRLYNMLNNAVKLLGSMAGGEGADPDYDVDVAPLESRDAVIHGCIGLYKPDNQTERRAQVCVPMSRYGTNQLLSIDEILDILAHELAHHLSIKKPLEEVLSSGEISDHDLQHARWEHWIKGQLRNMQFDWKRSRVAMGTAPVAGTGLVRISGGNWFGKLLDKLSGR